MMIRETLVDRWGRKLPLAIETRTIKTDVGIHLHENVSGFNSILWAPQTSQSDAQILKQQPGCSHFVLSP
jgi:hypothetical protein